jgi:hypothetical protein
MTRQARFQFLPTLILCVSSLAALDGVLRRLEHLRHEDHLLPTALRPILVLVLIPLVSGFLAARPIAGQSRVAQLLPLFLAPFALTLIKVSLDDTSEAWLGREGVSLAILALIAAAFAVIGGLLRLKAESG